jgi:hypothetical protein
MFFVEVLNKYTHKLNCPGKAKLIYIKLIRAREAASRLLLLWANAFAAPLYPPAAPGYSL